VEDPIENQQQVLQILKDNLTMAQNRMKQQADQHCSERSFEVGDWVFLRLQPYKQMSLKQAKKDNKLSPKYYGPYKVLQKTPLLKLDIKFELPMYNGEVNAERLDNWIRQIEVYCRIQRIKDDETKIQLASLRLEGATLIWWEAKTQEDMKKHGKVLSSWNDFVVAIRRQFYPLAYMQKAIMDWQNFRQAKGKNVQSYTQEFRKRALILGIDLSSQDTLLKYIGGLHSYLRHTILMFNPTKLDEVCVQATHLEARGKNVSEETSESSFESGEKGKGKFKGKGKKNVTIKMEKEKSHVNIVPKRAMMKIIAGNFIQK
jgi:hypothetical protein